MAVDDDTLTDELELLTTPTVELLLQADELADEVLQSRAAGIRLEVKLLRLVLELNRRGSRIPTHTHTVFTRLIDPATSDDEGADRG